MSNIMINEMFHAIQGEGFMAGTPVYFVRTSDCNTECDFCDTKYHKIGEYMNVERVADAIRSSGMQDIVFTGGEPTLQIRAIKEIMDYAPKHTFHLETNGSLYNPLVDNFDFISASPKKQLQYRTESYKKYNNLPQSTFKFVYENKKDKWWEGLIKRVGIPNDKVYMMPEGATREEQFKKMPEVLEYCLANKYQFSPRLHVLAYNDKRGV